MGADFYQRLGVSRDADDDAIKRAYKKLALKHHPDRNKGSEEASKKFKEVSEAYEVLSVSRPRRKWAFHVLPLDHALTFSRTSHTGQGQACHL